jgi:hypothetical protein
MAYSGSIMGPMSVISYKAEEAIEAYQIVKLGASAGNVQLNDSAGEQCLGVALEKAASGQAVSVVILGRTKVKCGSAITVTTTPVPIQGDGSGDAITATTADLIVGYALESAADGDYFMALICPGGIF